MSMNQRRFPRPGKKSTFFAREDQELLENPPRAGRKVDFFLAAPNRLLRMFFRLYIGLAVCAHTANRLGIRLDQAKKSSCDPKYCPPMVPVSLARAQEKINDGGHLEGPMTAATV
jgi:hypothetical protein